LPLVIECVKKIDIKNLISSYDGIVKICQGMDKNRLF
jgi:hypothetical protein